MLVLSYSAASAQELEPRAYSPSPVGTTFLIVAFGRSNGNITFDPSVPIEDVHANLYSTALGLGHTFGLFRRQALVTAVLPYVWGDIFGRVGERRGSIIGSGIA